ncbi:ABC transporter substrate-binding protein [Microbacterium sp. NPDC057659]|uniref:ABC transporter substrate-binding protein n=1 Tax=Microbacterium sp. NPDC057659 TaxID=3346198 RepID=UPI00366EA8EF
MRRSIIVAALVGALILSGCSASPGAGGGDSDVSEDTPIGAPEKTELTIALSAPNLDSQAPVYIAMDKGYYEDEGLKIKVIDADNIREGLIGGSLDVAVEDAMAVVDAANAGTGLKVVAGYRARQPYIIAASEDIEKPSDLKDKQIILGDAPGVPINDVRMNIMAEEGDFDIRDVSWKDVYPPGFSNAWVENFVAGQVELTPVFPRHIPIIEEAGGHFVVNTMKEWPNDVLTASEGWIAANPNTLARFIRATTKGMALYKDVSQQEYVQSMMEKHDFTVTDAERDPEIYAYGPELYNEDMTLDKDHFADALKAFGMEMPEWDSFVDTTNLERANAQLND